MPTVREAPNNFRLRPIKPVTAYAHPANPVDRSAPRRVPPIHGQNIVRIRYPL